MTTVHHSPPPSTAPFAIYEDPEDQEPPSPSEEGDVSFTSDMSLSAADIAIPSIESEHDLEEELEPYNGSYTTRTSMLSSSRRDSTMTENSFVSSLPSEISVASKPVPPANVLESRYSPRKERPPFRNPSSVRAMQMASPTPSLALEAPRERTKGYKLATPSKSGRSDSVSTTGTRRSRSHRDSLHRDYQAQQTMRTSATPQPLPLVLLHVTILPMQMPYTPDVMVKIMPEWLVENYKILEEKLQDIVLMRRGLLIQHPRDEYDVLEERILESLELKTPRLLKCGHFVAPDSDDEEANDYAEEHAYVTEEGTGRGSRMSGGTVTAEEDPDGRYPTPVSDDAGMCMDCHRQVKKPGHGVGAGTKRWDIKIYAANGLMRAGAWTAAWSEMERCDVEISPWIPHEVRKTLDKRLEQEQEAAKVKALYAAELQRRIEEEAASQKKLEEEVEAKRRSEEAELQIKMEAEAIILQKKLEEEAAEKRKLEATLTEKIEEAKEAIRLEFEAQALMEANGVAERFRAMEDALKAEREKASPREPPVRQRHQISSRSRSRSRHRTRSRSSRTRIEEIPLGTLLKNYFALQLRDSRNFFILILAALVVFLMTKSNHNWNLQQPTLDLADAATLDIVGESIIPVVVTSTATMTATSISTLLVTETRQMEAIQETSLPASSDMSELRAAVSGASQILEEQPNAAIVSASGTDVDDQRGDSILNELSEGSAIVGEGAMASKEPTHAPSGTQESVGLSEYLTSTVEAAPAESTTTEEPTLHIPVGEPTVENVVDKPVIMETRAEELVAEESVTGNPIPEELVHENPIPEEHVNEEPILEDLVTEEPITEEPIAKETIGDELMTEEPIAEKVAAEEHTIEEHTNNDFVAPAEGIQESDAPLVQAPFTAETTNSEGDTEAETLDAGLQESEQTLQINESPVISEDDSSPVALEKDEL